MNGEITKSIGEILASEGVYAGLTFGVSMRPMLREQRDTIVVEKPEGRLRKYDVALYRRGEQYVLHRVIKVGETDYVILGDNCARKEPGITDGQILGVLTGFYRNGKKYIDVRDRGYRFYVRVHCALYPVRRVYFAFRALGGRIWRRISGKTDGKKTKKE